MPVAYCFSFDTSLLQGQKSESLASFYVYLQNKYLKIHGDFHLSEPVALSKESGAAVSSLAAKAAVRSGSVSSGLKPTINYKASLLNSLPGMLKQIRDLVAKEQKNDRDLSLLFEEVKSFRSLK